MIALSAANPTVEPETKPAPVITPSPAPVEPAQPFTTPSEPKIQPCPHIPDGDEGFPKCQFSPRLRAYSR